MFYDTNAFPFAKALEEHWEAIRNEYCALKQHQLEDWFEKGIYEGDWKVFGLFDWPSGKRLEGAHHCPVTASVIEKHIPNHAAAGFSILKANTRIKPHVGYSKEFLRCHLGLIIPGKCALNVNGAVNAWEEGKTMIFDDTFVHSAWNKADTERVVLLIDFLK